MCKKTLILITIMVFLSCSVNEEEIEKYYETGELKELFQLKNGVINGEQKFYYKSGKIKVIVNALNGKYNGTYISYYENGEIKSKGNYIEGKLNGYWKYFSEEGKEVMMGNYEKGVMTGKWNYLDQKMIVDWGIYYSDENNLIMNIPKDWIIDESVGEILLVATSELENENDKFQENLNLIVDRRNDNKNWNIDDYLDKYYSNISNQFQEFSILQLSKTEIIPDISMYCVYTVTNGNTDYKVLNYFVVNEDKMYILSFYSLTDSFDNFLFLYEEIINSFQIKND